LRFPQSTKERDLPIVRMRFSRSVERVSAQLLAQDGVRSSVLDEDAHKNVHAQARESLRRDVLGSRHPLYGSLTTSNPIIVSR
jgi:hypothetical protein